MMPVCQHSTMDTEWVFNSLGTYDRGRGPHRLRASIITHTPLGDITFGEAMLCTTCIDRYRNLCDALPMLVTISTTNLLIVPPDTTPTPIHDETAAPDVVGTPIYDTLVGAA